MITGDRHIARIGRKGTARDHSTGRLTCRILCSTYVGRAVRSLEYPATLLNTPFDIRRESSAFTEGFVKGSLNLGSVEYDITRWVGKNVITGCPTREDHVVKPRNPNARIDNLPDPIGVNIDLYCAPGIQVRFL